MVATSPAASSWITQQLVRYLSELTPGPDQRPNRVVTLRTGAERAAEAVEAEVAGIIWDGRLAVALGFSAREHPAAALRSVVGGDEAVAIGPLGRCHALAVPVGEGGHLVLARSGDDFDRDERILIRAMGRILALSVRSVDAVTAERSLRRESDRRAREALRDPLTRLPNRTLFLDRLETAATKALRRNRSIAVLFMDLDGFKVVNDTLGHASGDELLQAVAQRVTEATRAADTVARLGGDEFAILVDDLDDDDAATWVAERVQEALHAPFRVSGRDIRIGASIGIALGPDPEEKPHLLLRDADLAMYRAKAETAGGHRVFSLDMRQRLIERIELERELRETIGQGGLACLYQPVVELDEGRLVGVEALVRWRHARRGLMPPAEFLPLAEEAGLIGLLDNWVLEEACRQLSHWRRTYESARDINVAVNISGAQLTWDGLPLFVERNISEWQLPASLLVLEISEGAIVTAATETQMCLADLKSLGIRLALDDFGTGYSSLGRLRDMPVDIMKIDRSFVTGIDRDPRRSLLTANIIRLSHELAIDVVAEGIETSEEDDALRSMGCTYGQGFHYGRPAPAAALDRLFTKAGAGPVVLQPVATGDRWPP
jgi:diguanylate cyclase (GGDEF)-like protein